MAKVAVILSGCGNRDGSEIHESVLGLLALHRKGHTVACFAPDKPQAHVINHYSGQEVNEQRNCLVEAARIARGVIRPLTELDTQAFDALFIPGGMGAATSLCTFATEGENCKVDEDLEKVILDFHAQKKPIGATCIAPALLAKVFQDKKHVILTLGNDEANKPLSKMGMKARVAKIDEMIADEENKIYTTPAYMEPPHLAKMFEGISKVVDRLG